MKCIKCGTDNITQVNYCKKCQNKFTENMKKEAFNKTLVGKIKLLENVKGYITLSKITGSLTFKIVALIVAIIPIFLFYFDHGNRIKIEKSNDYKIQYNSELDEYYLITKEEDAKVNLYVPNDVKELSIEVKDKEDIKVEDINYGEDNLTFYVLNDEGYYLLKADYNDINKDSDYMKIFVYRMDE